MSRASVTAGLALGPAILAAALCAPSQGLAQAAPDRYGAPPAARGDAPPSAYAASPAPPSGGLRGRMLSWPGKSAVAYQPPAYAPQAVARYAPPQAYEGRGDRTGASYGAASPYRRYAGIAPAAYAQPTGPTAPAAYAPGPAPVSPAYGLRPQAEPAPRYARSPAPGASQDSWRPVFAGGPSSSAPQLAGAPAAQPPLRSSYAAAPASFAPPSSSAVGASRFAGLPPPRGSAAQRYGYAGGGDSHAVRFYSVHRPFGLQPDPAPIPPQFFTNTADLAAPPEPLPTERTGLTTSGSSHSVRAAPDTSAN